MYRSAGVIIPPVPDVSTQGLGELPLVILWDPHTTHPQFVTSKFMKCNSCGLSIALIHWLDGTSPAKQPRVLHSIDRIVLLVSAVYGCVNKHKVLAHDEVILQCFTQQYLVPFVLFHRTGFTRDLADTCMALVRRGVNFHNMETIVLERRWETFSMQKAFDQHSSSNYHPTAIDQDFFSFELAKSPSDSLLTKCFLATFLKEEQVYLTEIVSTNVGDTISFDHTFEVATNIGYLREDKVWVPQYDSLFIVVNGIGKIVTWQLTKGTCFAQVEQVMRDLNNRVEEQKCKIKVVYIDNCCSLRKKIKRILGNDTIVKLDVFHAVQRIVRTLPKRHEFFHKCLQQLRLVFRTDGDSSKKRISNTPAHDVMLQKMETFVDEWKEVKSTSGKSLFTNDTFQAIKNLNKHIASGCLSNIPPNGGTNRNERFHSHIKSYFNRSRVGVLLAYALISVIIHSHNAALKVNGKYVSKPIRASPYYSMSPKPPVNHPPIGISPKLKHTEKVSETWEVDLRECQFDIEKVRSIYKCSLFKLDIARSLAGMKLTLLQKTVFDFEPFSVCTTDTPVANGDLQRRLSEYGLIYTPAMKDGNCFFSSVAVNLMLDSAKWAEVLGDLGIELQSSTSSKQLATQLRHAFVSELLGDHFSMYHSFLDMDEDGFRSEANRFLCDSYYNSDLGDTMPLALATAIRAHLIIFTTEPHSRQMYVSPEVQSVVGTVFVVYDPVGSGHYDAALPFNNLVDQKVKKCSTYTCCSCGVNSTDHTRKSCTHLPHYNTRCKCYKELRPCLSTCRCKNCANPHGKKEVLLAKRKRTPHSMQIPLPNSKRFAMDRGESVMPGAWSEFETIVLLEIFCFQEKED